MILWNLNFSLVQFFRGEKEIFNVHHIFFHLYALSCIYTLQGMQREPSLKILDSAFTAAQSVTVKPTGCGFDPHSRKWNIYLNLYFNFFALVSRQKRGVKFRHSTRNTSRTRRKWGTECLNISFFFLVLVSCHLHWPCILSFLFQIILLDLKFYSTNKLI